MDSVSWSSEMLQSWNCVRHVSLDADRVGTAHRAAADVFIPSADNCTHIATTTSALKQQQRYLHVLLAEPLLPSGQHLSYGGKREDYQNCSVLYCVLKLCTVISTFRWAVLTVLCIGFCHTGPIPLCIDLFVFICVYFVCFCFILHSCCITVSTVGWTFGIEA